MFSVFKRFLSRKAMSQLTEEQQKWNRLWELWAEEEIESPYKELMTYQSEVNNGGHSQYFCNTDNNGNLKQEIIELSQILPATMAENMLRAYHAHIVLDAHEDDKGAAQMIEQCDDFFFGNEQEIIRILEERAALITL